MRGGKWCLTVVLQHAVLLQAFTEQVCCKYALNYLLLERKFSVVSACIILYIYVVCAIVEIKREKLPDIPEV